MSENALDRKGELGRYSTRPNQKLTRHCERASGILHPWVGQLIFQTAKCKPFKILVVLSYQEDVNYSPALKKWELYWKWVVCHSVRPSVCPP